MSTDSAVPLLSMETNDAVCTSSESKEYQEEQTKNRNAEEEEDNGERLSQHAADFGMGVALGLYLASVAFFSAEALFFQFNAGTVAQPFHHELSLEQQTKYGVLLIIINLAYTVHFAVCLSSAITTLTFICCPQKKLMTSSTTMGGSSINIFRVILFQGGYFAAVTLLFLTIRAYLPAEYVELHTFTAAFIDRFAMVVVANSLFLLISGDRRRPDNTKKENDTEEMSAGVACYHVGIV